MPMGHHVYFHFYTEAVTIPPVLELDIFRIGVLQPKTIQLMANGETVLQLVSLYFKQFHILS